MSVRVYVFVCVCMCVCVLVTALKIAATLKDKDWGIFFQIQEPKSYETAELYKTKFHSSNVQVLKAALRNGFKSQGNIITPLFYIENLSMKISN